MEQFVIKTAVVNSTVVDCNETFSQHQKTILLLVMGGTGILSVLVCTVAVLLVVSLCYIKQFSYRLAMYQVLGTMLYSISMSLVLLLLHYNEDSLFSIISCKAVAFLIHYSMWVKLLLTLWLSFHLFCYVVFLKNWKKLEVVYVSTSVLLPLLHAWIPFVHNNYGFGGVWCYIRTWKQVNNCAIVEYREGIIEIFVLFYGPIVISLIANSFAIFVTIVVMLIRVYKSRRVEYTSLIRKDPQMQALKQLLPLLAYPIIYLLLLLSPLIDRIYDAITTKPSFELVLIHVITGSLMGVFAGSALMIHVFYLYSKPKIKPEEVQDHHTNQSSRSSYAVISNPPTGNVTVTSYSVPQESAIDREYDKLLEESVRNATLQC